MPNDALIDRLAHRLHTTIGLLHHFDMFPGVDAMNIEVVDIANIQTFERLLNQIAHGLGIPGGANFGGDQQAIAQLM
jgi:hypothetical protein